MFINFVKVWHQSFYQTLSNELGMFKNTFLFSSPSSNDFVGNWKQIIDTRVTKFEQIGAIY